MKTWKVILAILSIIVAFTACDDKTNPPNEQAKDQNTTISGLFGGNYSAIVKGHFTDTQWNGIPNKGKSNLDSGYGVIIPFLQNGVKTYFENNDVTIIVQSTTEYAKYKVDKDVPSTIYFNIVALDGALTSETSDNGITSNAVAFAISTMCTGNSASE